MHRPILARTWPPIVYVGADVDPAPATPATPAVPATPSAPKKPLSNAVLLALKNIETEAASSYHLYLSKRADREAEFNKKLEYLNLIPVYGAFIVAGVKTFVALNNLIYPPPDETAGINAYLAAAEDAVPLGIIAPPLDLEVTSAATSGTQLAEVVRAFRALPATDEENVLAIGASLVKSSTDPKAPFFTEALKVNLLGPRCYGGPYGGKQLTFDDFADQDKANLLRRPLAIAMLAAKTTGAPLEPVQEAAINALLDDQASWVHTVDEPGGKDKWGNATAGKSYTICCPYGRNAAEFAAIHAKIAKAAIEAAKAGRLKFNIGRLALAKPSVLSSTPVKVAAGAGVATGLFFLGKWILSRAVFL